MRAYVALCLLRVLLIASPGYIHPDEFFQSGEVFVPENRPWEFQPQHALRTPVLPWLLYRVPQTLLSVWWAPRVVALCLSFVVDWFVWVSTGRDETRLLLLASSWPMLVLQSRSFSNGIEAVCVAAIALLRDSPWLVGVVGATGLFARFTFPLFALPFLKLPPRWTSIVAALIVAGAFVAVDSQFYGRAVVTPWNALAYNSVTENVAAHGLHPRYLHALVNLPLLLGPIVVSHLRPSPYWIFPLVLLSISPHQEPRFLLPLVSSAIATCNCDWTLSRLQWATHLAHHGVAAFVFGILHHGGVVPSVRALTAGQHAVYWKTYPPPVHILQAENVTVVDAKGAPFEEAFAQIRDLLVAPITAVPRDASLVRGQCWGWHVSFENFAWRPSEWQLCQWRKRGV
jgi:phosphatidylinositol glycan class Z